MGDLHLASVADKEIAEEHAQWRHPDLEARRAATHDSAVEGVDAATSAWAAEERNRNSGQELSEAEGKWHACLARGAEENELNARKQFKVLKYSIILAKIKQ